MKRTIYLIPLLTFLFCELCAQSPYGYKGHRFYIQYNLGASVNLFGDKDENPTLLPYLNRFHDVSLNYTMNRHWVMGIHGTYSRDVASLEYQYEEYSYDARTTHSPIRTTEVAIQFSRFVNDLNAPLGTYINVGLGMAFTTVDSTLTATVQLGDFWSYQRDTVISYTAQRPYRSPILRLGMGSQHLIGDHLMINVAAQLGLNLAFINQRVMDLSPTNDDYDTGYVTSSEYLNNKTKEVVQQRVALKNFYHFRIGIGYLF